MGETSRPIHNWDPMKEDYFDQNFNSYITGAGANIPKHLQPASYRRDESNIFKLYVAPLNSRYDDNSLKNLFSEYGEVTDVYVDPKGYWGLVYFKSQTAANTAISSMNDHPIFKFKVSYAKEKEKSQDFMKQDPKKPLEQSKNSASSNQKYIEPKTNVKKSFNVFENHKSMESEINSTQTQSTGDSGDNSIRPSATNGIVPPKTSLQFKTIPNCYHCTHATLDICLNCKTPFCGMKCAILGFQGHTKGCIQVAPIGPPSQLIKNNTVEGLRESNIMAAPQNSGMNQTQSNIINAAPNHYVGLDGRFEELSDTSKMLQNFNDVTNDYRNSCQRAVSSTSRISNSYDVVEISDDNSEYSVSTRIDRPCKDSGRRHKATDEHSDKPQNPTFHKSDLMGIEDDILSRNRDTNGLSNRTDGKEGGNGKSEELRKSDRGYGKSEGRYAKSEVESWNDSSIQRKQRKNESSKTSEGETDIREDFIGFASNNGNRKPGSRGDRLPKADFRKNGSSTRDSNRSGDNRSSRSLTGSRNSFRNDISDSKSSRGTSVINGDCFQSRSSDRFNKEPMCDDDFSANAVNSRPHSSFTASNDSPTSDSGRVSFVEGVKIEVKLNDCSPVASVTIPKEKELFNKMLDDIRDEPSLQPVTELHEKLRCLANRNGVWFRSMIMSMDPLTVRLYDMGASSYNISEDDIKQLPEKYVNIPHFCYPVHFRNATDDELYDIKTSKLLIEIIPVKKDRGSPWIVDLVRKPFEKKLEEARQVRDSKKLTSNDTEPALAVDLTVNLKPNIPYKVFVASIKDNESFYVSEFSKIKLLTDMINKEDIESFPAYKDSGNGMCLAPYLGEWYRAKIISKDPCKITFVDFGNEEDCDPNQLKVLPEKYFKINNLAILVKLEKGTVAEYEIETEKEFTIIPVERDLKEKIWIVRTTASELFIDKTTGASSKSSNEQTKNVIKQVVVVDCVSSKEHFVMEIQNKQILDEISNTPINTFINNKVKNPEFGILYFAKYDGDWRFRSRVIKTSPLTVEYLDFGNKAEIELEDMRMLPEKWQSVPPLAFKITLKTEPPSEINVVDELRIVKESNNLWDLLQINDQEVKANVTTMTNTETKSVAASDERKLAAVSTSPKASIESGPTKAVTKITSIKEKLIEEKEIIDVLVMAKGEEGDYGVIKTEKREIYENIMWELLDSQSTLEEMSEPQLDDLCVLDTGDLLYRAKITEINPTTVFFIDLGYEDIVIPKYVLRIMPEHLREIEQLGFSITFGDDTLDVEENDQVFIQILAKIDENYFLVRKCEEVTPFDVTCIEQCETDSSVTSLSVTSCSRESQSTIDICTKISNEPIPAVDARSKPIQVEDARCYSDSVSSFTPVPVNKSIISELSNGLIGVFAVRKQYSKKLYSGLFLLQRNVTINNMLIKLDQLNHDISYKPVTGELIATLPQNEPNWTRGFVLNEPTNLNPNYRVALIDRGDVCYVNTVAPLHSEFKQIPSLALSCEITSFPRNRSALKIKLYKCEMHSSTDGVLWKPKKNKLIDTFYKVKFNPWIPSIDEMGIQPVVFKTNDRVKITSYNSSNKCFIVPVDDDNNDKRIEMLDSIMHFCVDGFSLNREPQFDEIVGVLYHDTFWRGQVLGKEDELFLVLIIDNGDEILVKPEDMKALPESLKKLYCTAVPVILAGVRITEINRKAGNYMKNIIAQETEFALAIEDSYEVVLQFVCDQDYNKENDGRTSLNDYLDFLLTPEWKLPEIDDLRFGEPTYTCDYLKYDHYEVGTTLTLYVVDTDADFTSLMVINRKGKSWKRMEEVNFRQRLQEYGETLNKAYVPVVNELCLAKHDGQWCRAVCIEHMPGKPIFVHLIDDGIMIYAWHIDIRRMISEFLNYNALAFMCYIQDPNIDTKKCDGKLLKNKEISGCTIVECLQSEEYRIVIKNVQKYFK